MKALSAPEIQTHLQKLKAWRQEDIFICREITFKSFIQAFSFMTQIALISEKMDHHPNWENVYDQLRIKLSTHDANGLTEKDFALAHEIEKALHHFDTV